MIIRTYRVNCSPFYNGRGYVLSFLHLASSKQEVIDHCESVGCYYNTIVSLRFENMLKKGLEPDSDSML